MVARKPIVAAFGQLVVGCWAHLAELPVVAVEEEEVEVLDCWLSVVVVAEQEEEVADFVVGQLAVPDFRTVDC